MTENIVEAAARSLSMDKLALARLIGVNDGTIYRWANGTRSPNQAARTLLLIATREPAAFKRALGLAEPIQSTQPDPSPISAPPKAAAPPPAHPPAESEHQAQKVPTPPMTRTPLASSGFTSLEPLEPPSSEGFSGDGEPPPGSESYDPHWGNL